MNATAATSIISYMLILHSSFFLRYQSSVVLRLIGADTPDPRSRTAFLGPFIGAPDDTARGTGLGVGPTSRTPSLSSPIDQPTFPTYHTRRVARRNDRSERAN